MTWSGLALSQPQPQLYAPARQLPLLEAWLASLYMLMHFLLVSAAVLAGCGQSLHVGAACALILQCSSVFHMSDVGQVEMIVRRLRSQSHEPGFAVAVRCCMLPQHQHDFKVHRREGRNSRIRFPCLMFGGHLPCATTLHACIHPRF